ncbi:Transcriptional activator hap5 [Lecanora helva]
MDPNPPGSGQQQQQQHPPKYDPSNGGHYGASAQVSQGLTGNYREILTTYWQQTISNLENETHDYKIHQLPLARIKKVMKADPDVKMISAEAPILFAKGCDIFITELTMRAWIHAEENKRRTLQRSDIASALAKSDMFDFLIDIVPREETASHAKRSGQSAGGANAATAQPPSASGIMPPQNNVQQQRPPSHPQPPQPQHLGHADYSQLGNSHPMGQEQEYRPQAGLYASQVQPDAAAYGQPQQPMFEGMYGYAPMAAPQQMYQVNQRGQDPSGAQNPGHQYQRHDGGDGDADAEGERDFEVV